MAESDSSPDIPVRSTNEPTDDQLERVRSEDAPAEARDESVVARIEAITPSDVVQTTTPAITPESDALDVITVAGKGYNIPQKRGHFEEPEDLEPQMLTEIPGIGELAFVRPSDASHFRALLQTDHKSDEKTKRALHLLLRIKNGTQSVRKTATRQIVQDAKHLGAPALLGSILPILKDISLNETERHLMIKIMGRLFAQLGATVLPYAKELLDISHMLLLNEDSFMRKEAQDLVSRLSKAIGLRDTLILVNKELDSADEYVQRSTGFVIAVIARSHGLLKLIPFFDAMLRSQRSWVVRHTGLRAIQQVARLFRSGILPQLNQLVGITAVCLRDANPRVRVMAANVISSLAEAANPYGIEAFEQAIEPLWFGVRRHRGKGLAAFLLALGSLIPLMDPENMKTYTERVLTLTIKEYSSPDEEVKRSVLQIIEVACKFGDISREFLTDQVLPDFFESFWLRRMAMDKRSARLIVAATVAVSERTGSASILSKLVEKNVLKDASEALRSLGLRVVKDMAASSHFLDTSARLNELLMDHLVLMLVSSNNRDRLLLSTIASFVTELGHRASPYIDRVVTSTLDLLNLPNPYSRESAGSLLGDLAPAIHDLERPDLLLKVGTVLYEQLGDDYPDVLAAVLNGLTGVVSVVGLQSMQPPIRDLLPRLTPILRNRDEQVQEACITLVGKIAERGADYINAREWIRVCFELLELMKSTRKSVRRRANDTLGYIALGIGPQDVLVTLLNNLKVQDRQSRVSTAVALGIVAEKCEPFTVLPALMNEYLTPDLNVQHGVLKALAFMFEHIGDTSSDYLESITTLVDHALTDRNQVHRQTGSSIVKFLALGSLARDQEDVLVHFINELLPNIFETAPHLISRVLDGLNALRHAVGFGPMLAYVWAGLFHPARKVREVYWQLYNQAYVHNSDAMVPYYPVIDDDLDVWL